MSHVKNYALCLIDLQDEFRSSITPRLIDSVNKEISKAVKNKRDILVVLYRECGPLIKEIADLICAYPRHHTLWKLDDDGGPEMAAALSLMPQHVRVCGVNTDACVQDTVESASYLFEEYPKLSKKRIQIVENGCWTISGDKGHQRGLSRMEAFHNVEVV